MRKIYVIGTIHGITPNNELKSILKKINPNQILIEIVERDLKNKSFKGYPNEMVYTYEWGIKNQKIINGFDFKIRTVKKPVLKNKKLLKKLDEKAIKIISKHNWKEWNKSKYDEDKEFYKLQKRIIDFKNQKIRENKMLSNIKKIMVKNKKILVLTGVSHLRFFEKKLKGAIFPFR